MKKLFIFDCFGVLAGEVAPIVFAKHLPPEEAKAEKHKIFSLADRGLIDLDEVFARMVKVLGVSEEVLRREWFEQIRVNPSVLEKIAAYRKAHPEDIFAVISNAPCGLLENMFRDNGIYDLFDRVYVSWRFRLCKPDPAYYELCLDDLKAAFGEFSQAVMFDDNAPNLAPLPALGVTPVLYRGMDDLDAWLN